MFSGQNFRGLAALAVLGLSACGGGNSAIALPVAGAAGIQSGHRFVQNARALAAGAIAPAADCSQSIVALSMTEPTGSCSNVQVAAPTYGPDAPAELVPGLHPADLQAAYALPSATAGSGITIGIVVVGDNPNLENDLAVYRSTFGLPACTSAGNCLRIIADKSKAADANWSREISLDVDMTSAVCPKCKLLVVEAQSSKDTDLALAVSLAIQDGANVVSNSYTITESSKTASVGWSHPGIPIVAATGDSGFGTANWPAASPNVIAVGATTLRRDPLTARGWSETAWSLSGSGCSKIAPKPIWQTDTGCAMRTVADVAAVGDPATPVAVFDTYQNLGWVQMGGTSVATPIVAGVYALAGNGSSLNAAASLYANRSALFQIGAGSNGTCTPSYLCTATSGYSGPVGLGSPKGIAAF